MHLVEASMCSLFVLSLSVRVYIIGSQYTLLFYTCTCTNATPVPVPILRVYPYPFFTHTRSRCTGVDGYFIVTSTLARKLYSKITTEALLGLHFLGSHWCSGIFRTLSLGSTSTSVVSLLRVFLADDWALWLGIGVSCFSTGLLPLLLPEYLRVLG